MAHMTTIDGKSYVEADNLEEAIKIWFREPKPFLECLDQTKSDCPKAYVYVLELNNGTVKIGLTQNIEHRKRTICGTSGLEIKKEWHTDLLDRSAAYKVEKLSHDELQEYRTLGEYFNVPFDDACFTVALYGIIVNEGEKYKAEHGITRKY